MSLSFKNAFSFKNNIQSDDSLVLKNLRSAISPFENNCDGYGNMGASGNSYILGVVLGAGIAKLNLRHDGSQVLDEINAFDRAEVADTNIGQINMTIVSSFCGPAGIIWGYDVAKIENLRTEHELNLKPVETDYGIIPVYSAKPLMEATKKLFGTVDDKRFPLIPGGHVPCAGKSFKDVGPRHIYAGIAIGIAKNREKDANLLMEDLGWLPLRQDRRSQRRYKRTVLQSLAKSIADISRNQKVEYKEIFTEIVDVVVTEGNVGCALVAAPYFTIAKKAVPGNLVEKLPSISISDWEKIALR